MISSTKSRFLSIRRKLKKKSLFKGKAPVLSRSKTEISCLQNVQQKKKVIMRRQVYFHWQRAVLVEII